MSGTAPALIVAAAGVGFGHAVLPDHWVPLAVVGRTRRYPVTRVARLSGAAGIAHVLVSLLLGAAIIAVGLQFRATIEHAQNAIVGSVLIATGLAFVALELTGRGHTHDRDHHPHDAGHSHDHDHSHDHGDGHSHDRHNNDVHDSSPRLGRLAGVMIPFGAAASPDLTILPVFVAASTAGAGAAVGSLVAFSFATVATIVGLTVIATVGGYKLKGRWLDRWSNVITAATLVLIGALVFTGVI
jgi:hypothetical protein